jgi:hypothetical protein
MQLLSSAENVVSDDEYPYENRYLTYIHKAAKIIGKKASADWNNDDLIDDSGSLLGPIPYSGASIIDRERFSNSVLVRMTNAFFDEIVMKNKISLDKYDEGFYSEKASNWAAEEINQKIYSKNIFLIRDPRDIFISIKNFNEKRGSSGFGWIDGQSDVQFAMSLCKGFKAYLEHYTNIEEDDRKLKIRYEDLISNPYIETARISRWLGADLNYDFVLRQLSSVSQHISTKSGKPQTERWRAEMNQEVGDVFQAELGALMIDAGYLL